MRIISLKTYWIVCGFACCLLYFGSVPPTDAAGSVPVVTTTATPAPCTGNCKKLNPDVISMTDLPAGVPPEKHLPSLAIFGAKTRLVITRVTRFPGELDIELRARRGTRETVHLPFAVPPSTVPSFPQKALLDAVVEVTEYARILYRTGSAGSFNTVTVSQPITVAQPVFITVP